MIVARASSVVLDCWSFRATAASFARVIPDGCRDLIVRTRPRGTSSCFVSPLDRSTRTVQVARGDDLLGVRLSPGTHIDLPSLVDWAGARDLRMAFGFSDQAHFSREARRWFNESPATIKPGSAVFELLCESGYG